MNAVIDTSVVNYLIQTGCIDILAQLLTEAYLPSSVLQELRADGAPEAVRAWALDPPSWLKVAEPSVVHQFVSLDLGESDVISLALDLRIPNVFIDERKATAVAIAHGLQCSGTLGLLDLADTYGLLDFEDALIKLMSTNFHAGSALVNLVRQRVEARKRQRSSNSPSP